MRSNFFHVGACVRPKRIYDKLSIFLAVKFTRLDNLRLYFQLRLIRSLGIDVIIVFVLFDFLDINEISVYFLHSLMTCNFLVETSLLLSFWAAWEKTFQV